MIHYRKSDYVTQTWKNGLGVTLEIAKDTQTPFRWRLSSASVSTTGPFSFFPNYRRTLVLLNGGPVSLVHDGERTKTLKPLEVYDFDGEWETHASVESPADDFNVFVKKGEAEAETFLVHQTSKLRLTGDENFFFVVRGDAKVGKFTAGAGETLRFSPQESEVDIALSMSSTGILIQISYS